MKRAAVMVAVALGACGHNEAPPAVPSDRIVTVTVPVAVQPIKPADVPTPPAPLGPRPTTVQQQEDALLSQVCSLEAYVILTDPLLRLSAGLPPVQAPTYPECSAK